MPLATDIVIEAGSLQPVTLRPSLRAAMRLEREYGFPKLSRGIAEGSYSVLANIVRECSRTRDDANAILSIRPIGKLIEVLTIPCQHLILALAGYDSDSKPKEASTSKSIPFAEHFESLFRIASGNLGWTPDAAYAATPAEIIAAFEGRADLLRSIFGGTKPEEQTDPAIIDHREGIQQLREIFS